MKKSTFLISSMFLLILSIKLETVLADARAQVVDTQCGTVREHNAAIFVPNFVAALNKISNQLKTTDSGQAIVGSGLDAAYGFAQCYGDLSLIDCGLCYAEACTVLPKCFPYIRGIIFLDGCFMRSDNYNFFQEYSGPDDKAVCGNATRKDFLFKETATRAMKDVVSRAPADGGHARAEISGPGNVTAYVLADCWKTLNESYCKACLDNAATLAMGCLPWSEGRALNRGCFLRYSDKKFVNDDRKISKGGRPLVIILALVSSVTAALLITTAGLFFGRRELTRRRRVRRRLGALTTTQKKSELHYRYEVLEKATNFFNSSNKLGQGGSGSVYKGVLPDGKIIAVKRLVFTTRQWVDLFFNEVNLIKEVNHKNLVKLLGCSITGPESLLVYEYVPNQSLQDHLFDKYSKRQLSWDIRYNIIVGTAEGLTYLHEESHLRIIHRDIKLSNVLLDENHTAKIADFGLVRLFPEDKTHISTAIAGTLGYMAPEYVVRGKLTEKADVFSFGVCVIEVVSGKRNHSFSEESVSILEMVWNCYGSGSLCEAVDPSLDGVFQENEAARVLQIGLLCTQASADLRPTMSMVVKMLTDNVDLPNPSQPPFLNSSNIVPIVRKMYSYFKTESLTQSSGNSITESWIEPR